MFLSVHFVFYSVIYRSYESYGISVKKHCIIRPPRPYVLLVMFFYSPLDLRAPLADRRETLHRDRYLRQLYNASPKIRGPSTEKFYHL